MNFVLAFYLLIATAIVQTAIAADRPGSLLPGANIKPSLAPAAPQQAKLSGTTLTGQSWALEQVRGKVVLVVFWSKNCAVCRDRMPELRANYAGWKGKPFELVSVSTDDNSQDVKDYERILSITVPQAKNFPRLWRGEKGYQDNFGSFNTLPTSFLLDRQGRIVKQFVGRIDPAIWDDIAEMVLQ